MILGFESILLRQIFGSIIYTSLPDKTFEPDTSQADKTFEPENGNENGLFSHLQNCFYATHAVLCPWLEQYKLSGFCGYMARLQHCALCIHNSNKDKDRNEKKIVGSFC